MFNRSLLKLQFHDIQELQSAHQSTEFPALSRSIKGEDVPNKEIKEDVAKAIKVLLTKIDPNNDDALAADLLIAYNALTE